MKDLFQTLLIEVILMKILFPLYLIYTTKTSFPSLWIKETSRSEFPKFKMIQRLMVPEARPVVFKFDNIETIQENVSIPPTTSRKIFVKSFYAV